MKRVRNLLPAFLLCGLVWVVFGRTVGNGFVAWDDPTFVWLSPAVGHGLSWEGLRWAFEGNLTRADTSLEYWIPLTALSRLVDAEVSGMAPGWVHGMSVAYHALAAGVLFAALRGLGMGLAKAWWVAALFALHPLQVEAVCWASGRKDVLGGLFWALTMLAYAAYARNQTRGRYLLVVASFACGLMAKPSVLTLPAALLLLDFWPLGRFTRESAFRLFVEKVPLIMLAGISLLTSVLAQIDHGAMKPLGMYPLWLRVGNAAVACVDYVRTFLWPVGLAPIYPHPGLALQVGWAVAAGLLVIGVSLCAWRSGRRLPWLFTGWFWFLGTLVPMLGLIQLGGAARADRYMYSSIIGLCWIAVEGGGALLAKLPDPRLARQVGGLAGGVACTVLGALSFAQAGLWRDTIRLFEHAVRVTESNRQAHFSLAIARLERGESLQAREHLGRVLSLEDSNIQAWTLLGKIELQEDRNKAALWCFESLTSVDPGNAQGYYHVGYTRALLGDAEGAVQAYLRAATLRPEWARPLLQAADIREKGGDSEAAARLRKMASVRPVGHGPEGGLP